MPKGGIAGNISSTFCTYQSTFHMNIQEISGVESLSIPQDLSLLELRLQIIAAIARNYKEARKVTPGARSDWKVSHLHKREGGKVLGRIMTLRSNTGLHATALVQMSVNNSFRARHSVTSPILSGSNIDKPPLLRKGL